MNTIPCQYAIVRFMPFIETGEFSNIGIVLLAPQQSILAFKLITRRYARITQFFHTLNADVYRSTIKTLQDELDRLKKSIYKNNEDIAIDIFNELIRPRETMLRFSPPRVVLTNNINEKLDELFSFYVEHDFARKEYQEHALEKTVRGWLQEKDMNKHFKKEKVGDRDYTVPFPFVKSQHEAPIKIIKPLYLGHENLGQLIDHGGLWLHKLHQLNIRDALPSQVLFTIEQSEKTQSHQKECQRVITELEKQGIQVLPHMAKHEIIQFAA